MGILYLFESWCGGRIYFLELKREGNNFNDDESQSNSQTDLADLRSSTRTPFNPLMSASADSFRQMEILANRKGHRV